MFSSSSLRPVSGALVLLAAGIFASTAFAQSVIPITSHDVSGYTWIWVGDKAYDGSTSTEWRRKKDEHCWIDLNLGSSQPITQLQVVFSRQTEVTHPFLVFVDGVQVYSGHTSLESQHDTYQNISFSPQSGATVRIQYNGPSSDNAKPDFGVAEVRIIGGCTAPQITSHPRDTTVLDGETAVFTVAATDADSYQWQRNGANISGATSTTYTLTAAQMGDDGASFRCVVTNGCDQVVSSAAVLTVNPVPVSISQHPADLTVTDGEAAEFSVSATGTQPFAYQWRENGTTRPGANDSIYTIASVAYGQSGSTFECEVSNPAGTVTTSAATLTVTPVPLSITQQPRDTTVEEGDQVAFSVSATGTGPVSYQWRDTGGDIPGATSSTYSISSASIALDGNQYYCRLSNPAGSLLSDTAVLTVNAIPPVISRHPADTSVAEGNMVSMEVTASGTEPLAYQWRRNGVDIAGQTANLLSYGPVSYANDTNARFDCVISNQAGTVTSSQAVLTVIPAPPVITIQPQSVTVAENQSASFSITASGEGTLSYQWKRNGTDISGATGASYTTPPLPYTSNGDQFSCAVSNEGGATSSDQATVTVTPIPVSIIQQPSGITVNDGQGAQFAVVAEGTLPLSYQWQENGVDLPGETGDVLSLLAVSLSQDGNAYSCAITNPAGSVSSDAAVLTVLPLPPTITGQPRDQYVYVGQSATFSIAVQGSEPLSYQWRVDGADIAGANGASYTTEPVVLTDDQKVYTCFVSNSTGSILSGPAVLHVSETPQPPEITAHPQSVSVSGGTALAMTVTASGTMPLSYAWFKDGAAVGGDTAELVIDSASLDDAGSYWVIVTNSEGADTSDTAIATVIPHGTVNSQMIAISGRLFDDAGNPVGYPDPAEIDVTINLMNHPTAGASLYSESFRAADNQAIVVEDGSFVARLGEGTSAENLGQVLASQTNLWVEITIEGDPSDVLQPRTPLTAAPYAVNQSPAVQQSAPTIMKGEGNPVDSAIEAEIGTYYVDTLVGSTWLMLNSGWKMID
jgi:hypothetical protein